MKEPVLQADGIEKRYGRAPALAGVSLSVQPGELFGLLGPNGAGKTTLLSILAGLTDADRGRITLFDQPLNVAARNRRHLIGIATQDLAIYPELTARENLEFFGKLYGMAKPDLTQRVQELLVAVGLQDRADHRAGTFSGGMKRRLNLAVAVVHRPKLLLLDEPTTGVDPQSRNHIFDLVRSLNSAGLTVIYTSHYMEEVQSLCPRIAILDAGQVQACDTLPNLLKRLNAILRVRASGIPDSLVNTLRSWPEVLNANATAGGLEIVAADLAPLVPRFALACANAGIELTAIDLEQPTLERVFLSLTGRALRD
jgi:ABC-2 type transport system ATP-binding protein